MKIAIAIFVKTPGVSPLKTRLAATIGQDKAEYFYQLSLKCIINTLNKTDITPFWAIAEKECLDHTLWSNFNRLHTGEGDLGDRQSHVYHKLLMQFDAVMLIGGDAPQLSENIIHQAKEALKSYDFVMGPADDGGYYLLAGKKAIPSEVWSSTPWSHAQTKDTFIAQLDSKPHELSTLTDVDNEADLYQILNEMPASLNEDQVLLKNWINQL